MSRKKILKGAITYMASNISARALNMVFIVVVTWLVGAEGFGLIGLAISVKIIFSSFGMVGMPMASQRYLSGKLGDEERTLLSSMFQYSTVMAILLTLFLVFTSNFIATTLFNDTNLTSVLQIIAFALLFEMPYSLFRGILAAQQKVKSVFKLNFVESLSKLLALGSYFIVEDKIVAIAFSIPISALVTCIYGLQLIKDIKFSLTKKFSWQNIVGAVKKSIPFYFIGMSYFLLNQTDRIMLGMLSNSEMVGYYMLGASLAQIASMIHVSVTGIMMPEISSHFKTGTLHKVKDSYMFSTKISGFVNMFIFVIFLFLGKELLHLIFNIEHREVFGTLIILSLFTVISSFVGPSGALLSMSNQQVTELINSIIQIFVNIVLNYFFIKNYGVIGAAFATFLSGILLNSLQIYQIYKKIKINILFNKILLLIIPLIFLIYLYSTIFEHYNIFSRIFFLMLVLLFFNIIFYFLMNQKEKQNARSLILRLKGVLLC